MVDKRGSADVERLREAWIEYDISRIRRSTGSSDVTHRQIAEQIARLAGANDIDRLHRGISVELTEYWWSERENQNEKKMTVLARDWLKLMIRELEQVQYLSNELSVCLENLGGMAATVLAEEADQEKELIEPLKKLAAKSAECLSKIRKLPSRPQGRSPLVDNLSSLRVIIHSFHQFTLHLLWDVREAGGRLTFEKNTGMGSLTKALEILRPHVPNLIPKSLPLSTLWRIKQWASIPERSLLKKLQDKK
jgi:hypothetical protein